MLCFSRLTAPAFTSRGLPTCRRLHCLVDNPVVTSHHRRQRAGTFRTAAASAAPALAEQQALSQQREAMYYLVKNDQGQPVDQASGPWLEVAPRGAYTTARTVGGDSVLELSFHIQRLANTAALMMEAAAAAAAAADGAPKAAAGAPLPPAAAAAADAAQLRPRVLSAMQAAVKGYRAASGDATGELKLTVLVTWPGCDQNPTRPAPPAGSDSAAAAAATGSADAGLDVQVHISPLPPRPSPPVRVVMRGAPRQNAEAKDSEWVRQRRSLWQGLAPGTQEVVLVGEGGALYEGLSSNFFAVKDGAVYTAGEGILAGTVREVVLAVAKREGIPVVLEPPRLADLECWEGCFISSTSRLLLPVDEAGVFPAQAGGPSPTPTPSAEGQQQQQEALVPLQRVRRFERGGLVGRLEALVMAELAACSEPLF